LDPIVGSQFIVSGLTTASYEAALIIYFYGFFFFTIDFLS